MRAASIGHIGYCYNPTPPSTAPDQTSENMHAEEVRDMEIDAAAATPQLATKAVFASQTILFWDD